MYTHTHIPYTHSLTCTHTYPAIYPENVRGHLSYPTLTIQISFRQHTALANSSSSAVNPFLACFRYAATTWLTSWSVAMKKHQNGWWTSHTCIPVINSVSDQATYVHTYLIQHVPYHIVRWHCAYQDRRCAGLKLCSCLCPRRPEEGRQCQSAHLHSFRISSLEWHGLLSS